MSWLGLVLLLAGLVALFALWDLIFNRGRGGRGLGARVIELTPWRFRNRHPRNGERR